MSKHPTERVRSVAEMQATSMQQSDKALRRLAPIEERLARLEGRLAEKDELVAEFREAYGRQADTIAALTAVVRELEAKVGRGVDQVITGLEGRITELEGRALAVELPIGVFFDTPEGQKMYTLSDIQADLDIQSKRVTALESKPKRGRPKGSKNKPKDTPPVEVVASEIAEDNAQDGDSSNPEASEGQ